MKLWQIQLMALVVIMGVLFLFYWLIGTSNLPDWVKFALLK